MYMYIYMCMHTYIYIYKCNISEHYTPPLPPKVVHVYMELPFLQDFALDWPWQTCGKIIMPYVA